MSSNALSRFDILRMGSTIMGQRQDVEQRVVQVLSSQTQVVVISSPKDKRYCSKLYLWLSDEEFATLTQPYAEQILEPWVRDVLVDRATRAPLTSMARVSA